MQDLIVEEIFELFHVICVIALASYFIIRTKIFNRVLEGKGSNQDTLLIILFFGALSIVGTLSSISLNGSPANVRDLGPIIAGLTFGPWIGLAVGLIGALFRFTQGGLTVIPCVLSTILAGFAAGILWKINGRSYIGTLPAVVFVLLMQILHLLLIILLVGNTPEVRAIIENLWVIMLPLYVTGILIYSIVFRNYQAELKTREELEKEKVELQVAKEIQESFLPKTPPSIAGYDIHATASPAREVGGDFYDFIPMEDGRTGFVISDVSGKNVSAALFMALSCTLVRVSAGWIQDPKQVAERVNTWIHSYDESGMFFSMMYGLLSPETGSIRYVNAGHPPPLLFKISGIVQELPRTGPIIGFMDPQQYTSREVFMENGDLLVCYTDGVTEAKDASGEMFEKSRLYEVIHNNQTRSAEEIIQSVIFEIQQFAGAALQFDDITLLVIKRVDGIVGTAEE